MQRPITRAAANDADPLLAADHHVRREPLRQQLLRDRQTQTELRRQLREVNGKCEVLQAQLEQLENEEMRLRGERRQREPEDEERRAWFETSWRGWLAYRAGGCEWAG